VRLTRSRLQRPAAKAASKHRREVAKVKIKLADKRGRWTPTGINNHTSKG
jgi:hypothetical protein